MRECPTCEQVFEKICLDCANQELTKEQLQAIVKEVYEDEEFPIILEE